MSSILVSAYLQSGKGVPSRSVRCILVKLRLVKFLLDIKKFWSVILRVCSAELRFNELMRGNGAVKAGHFLSISKIYQQINLH